jgi:hypothetical protein
VHETKDLDYFAENMTKVDNQKSNIYYTTIILVVLQGEKPFNRKNIYISPKFGEFHINLLKRRKSEILRILSNPALSCRRTFANGLSFCVTAFG